MTKYIEAFSWTNTIENFLVQIIQEKPLTYTTHNLFINLFVKSFLF